MPLFLTLVELNNRAYVSRNKVDEIVAILRRLIRNNYELFCELVRKCHNPNYKLHEHHRALLNAEGLMRNGEVLGWVENIVLSSVTGKIGGFRINSPLRKDATKEK